MSLHKLRSSIRQVPLKLHQFTAIWSLSITLWGFVLFTEDQHFSKDVTVAAPEGHLLTDTAAQKYSLGITQEK